MASIRVRKRSRKTSTGLCKLPLSSKKTKYERRSSVTVNNTPSAVAKESTEEVTKRTRKQSSSQPFGSPFSIIIRRCNRQSLRLQSKKIAGTGENSLTPVEKISMNARKFSVNAHERQTRNSLSRIGVVQDASVIYSKKTFDHCKTPVSTKCVFENHQAKSVEVSGNSLAVPLRNISNKNNKNQVSCINTRNSSLYASNISPILKENSTEKVIRRTRSSVSKSLAMPLKKACTKRNTLNDSEIEILAKSTKKSSTINQAKTIEKTQFSATSRKKSAEHAKKSVDNSPIQLYAKCRKSVRNQKQENLKCNPSTRSSNQASDHDDIVLASVRRRSTRHHQKSLICQEHVSDKNSQLPLVTPVKKNSISKKPTSGIQKNTHSAPCKKPEFCQIQTTMKKPYRLSLSPLRKIPHGSNNMETVSLRCTTRSSADRGRENNTQKSSQAKKLKDVKKSSASRKYKKAKSLNLSSIPVDDLMPKSSFVKRKVKSVGHKLPGKNTLKRKRITLEAMRVADEGYQDDIFESKNFDRFKELLITSPVSNDVLAMSTPKFGFQVTPVLRKNTPVFKDCFNPEELAKRRKVAEEYMYRRNKNRKNNPQVATPVPVIPEKKKLEFNEVLRQASKIQKEIEKQALEENEDEDSYFSFTDSPLR